MEDELCCPVCHTPIGYGDCNCPHCGFEGLNLVFSDEAAYLQWCARYAEPYRRTLTPRVKIGDGFFLVLYKNRLYAYGEDKNHLFNEDITKESLQKIADNVASAAAGKSHVLYAGLDGKVRLLGPHAGDFVFEDVYQVFASPVSDRYYLKKEDGSIYEFGCLEGRDSEFIPVPRPLSAPESFRNTGDWYGGLPLADQNSRDFRKRLAGTGISADHIAKSVQSLDWYHEISLPDYHSAGELGTYVLDGGNRSIRDQSHLVLLQDGRLWFLRFRDGKPDRTIVFAENVVDMDAYPADPGPVPGGGWKPEDDFSFQNFVICLRMGKGHNSFGILFVQNGSYGPLKLSEKFTKFQALWKTTGVPWLKKRLALLQNNQETEVAYQQHRSLTSGSDFKADWRGLIWLTPGEDEKGQFR